MMYLVVIVPARPSVSIRAAFYSRFVPLSVRSQGGDLGSGAEITPNKSEAVAPRNRY